MTQNTCRHCKHWERDSEATGVGDCHRFPPVLIEKLMETKGFEEMHPGERYFATRHTATGQNDYCGEFQPAQPSTPKHQNTYSDPSESSVTNEVWRLRAIWPENDICR